MLEAEPSETFDSMVDRITRETGGRRSIVPSELRKTRSLYNAALSKRDPDNSSVSRWQVDSQERESTVEMSRTNTRP